MTLDPLLTAGTAVQIHTALALFAVLLTIAIFAVRRGTPLHRGLGRLWVAMMAVVAISSFWINEFRMVGPFSPIHLISIFVLVQLYFAVRAARRGDIRQHRRTMKSMVFGALILAGGFTLLPGRRMFEVLAGG
ncbi:MAG: DUF2306 domain-containing protein [Sulfitobacter sp.]|nr:DUF2306 domain-containing protein [Sulfitobacter sp.]